MLYNTTNAEISKRNIFHEVHYLFRYILISKNNGRNTRSSINSIQGNYLIVLYALNKILFILIRIFFNILLCFYLPNCLITLILIVIERIENVCSYYLLIIIHKEIYQTHLIFNFYNKIHMLDIFIMFLFVLFSYCFCVLFIIRQHSLQPW